MKNKAKTQKNKEKQRYFLVISPERLKKIMERKQTKWVAIIDLVETNKKTTDGQIMLEEVD